MATKQGETRWVSRLFVLDQDSLSCFYESAPHLQDAGKNVLTKVVIPIKRQISGQTQLPSVASQVLIPTGNETAAPQVAGV